MRKIYAAIYFFLLFSATGFSQIQLIPVSEGGFENTGNNGWTFVNPSARALWVIGTATKNSGNQSAYISVNGTNNAYSSPNYPRTAHFYRDISVPAGGININLSFQLQSKGEINYDRLLVYTAPTTVTPVANSPNSNSTALTGATLIYTQTAFTAGYDPINITLPTALAGTTVRLIFTWQNDNSGSTQPPASVDDVSLIYTAAIPAYQATFTALDLTEGGTKTATSWCAGETRNVLVTVKNTGTSAWTSGGTGVNFSYWWTPGQNRDFNGHSQPFSNLLPNASQTLSLPITAPTSGPLVLNFDLVKETFCWFADNVPGCSGPGNTIYTSSSITINALPGAPTGAAQQAFCNTSGSTVTNLTATGTTIKWYAASSGGTALATSTPLVDGTHYYASQTNGSGCESSARLDVLVSLTSSVPVQPGAVTGNSSFCQGTAQSYSVPNVAGVTFTWTAPAGFTILSGQGTNTINYTTAAATSGTLQVTPSNSCGNGTAQTLVITVNTVPAQPSVISGNTSFCISAAQTYSVTAVAGVTYTWVAPAGWTIFSGQGTNSISYTTASAVSGNLQVTPSNGCGNGTARTLAVTVNTTPAQPSAIAGSNSVCAGSSQTYSVTNVAGVTYTWNTPAGWTLVSGQNTNSVNYAIGSAAGTVQVTPSNTCGTGTTQNLAVSINSTGTWIGVTSNNWFTPSNWCGGVPTATTDVTIPAVGLVPNQPSIGAAGAVSRSITINGTLTTTAAFNLDVYGDWTNNGGYTANTGSITFTGGSNNILAGSNATTFYNLIVNKGAIANTLTSTTNVFTATNLTITQGNLILTNPPATPINVSYVVTGNVSVAVAGILTDNVNWANGHLLSVGGNIAIDGIFDYNSGNLPHVNMNGAGNKTVRTGTNPTSGFGFLTLSTGNYTASGNLVVNSNFWAMFSTAGSFSTNGQTITANQGFLISGGTTNINGGTVNVTGGMFVGVTPNGISGTANFSAGTLNVDALTIGTTTPTVNGVFNQSGGTANIQNLLINNTNTASVYNCTNSPVINITGNWTNNETFNAGSSQVNFNGTSTSTISGTSQTTFNNLSIANTSGVSLSINTNVNNTLNLSSGLVTTGSNVLTINSAGTAITGGSSSSYVNGKLAKIFGSNGAGSYLFKIGKGGNYRPLTFAYTALTSQPSTVTVEQFETALTGTLPTNIILYPARHWDVTQSGGTNMNYKVTLDPTGYTPVGPYVKILKKEAGVITATNATTPSYTNTTGFTTFNNTNDGTNSFALGHDCSSTADAGSALADICQGGTSAPLGGTITGTATGGTWTSSVAGGTFTPNATTLTATWTPPSTFFGTATLTLTPTGGLCAPNTFDTKTLNVIAGPTGNFTATSSAICFGGSVTFTAPTPVAPAVYSYIFYVDGVKVQGANNVNTYSTSGLSVGSRSITVDIANANNCGKTFGPIIISVNPPPMATLIADKASICPGDMVTFTAGTVVTGNTYNFKLNGSSVQSGSSNTYSTTTFTATNNPVTVDVTNSNTCTATSAPVTVTINPVPSGSLTSMPFTTVNTAAICSGDNIIFTATAGVGNTYDFKVNGTSQGSSASNTFASTTLINPSVVTVDVTNASGCTKTFNAIAVTVNPLPTGSLTATENSGMANDNSICANSPVTFTATMGYANYAFYLKGTGTVLYNGTSNVFTTSTLVDQDYLTVVVTSGSNCTATFTSLPVTVVASPAGMLAISPSNIICAGDNVIFTATSDPTFTNYLFKLNGTTTLQNGPGNTFSTTGLLQGDVVTVDVTNTNTCVTTFNSITMTVNPLPTGTLTAVENVGLADDGTICTGTTVVFTVPMGFSNYNFIKNNLSVQNSSSDTYTTSSLISGDNVTVAVTNGGGCIGLLNNILITVNPLPVVAAIGGGATSVCVNSLTLAFTDATAGGTWSVTNGTGSASITSGGVATGLTPGDVTINYTFTNGNGCSTTVNTTLTVNAPPTVAPITGNVNVCTNPGNSSQFSDVTPGGTWSSNNTGVATVDPNTGLVSGVASGNANISYTVTDANGCSTTVFIAITVSATPSVAPITTTDPSGFNVCIGGMLALQEGTSGGTWSSSNTAVATVNASGIVTGITNNTAIITYSITTSCGQPSTASQVITVNAPPSATIAYAGSPYCSNSGTATVTLTGALNGTYSKTAGIGTLSISASTGDITLGTSTPGTYTVTYTIAASGGCGVYTTNATVSITAIPTITSFSYSGTPYCSTVTSASPSLVASSTTGTYSYIVTSGGPTLTINPSTGVINPSTSSAGTYAITYTINASGGCAAVSLTTPVTITATPTGTISYAGGPFCTSAGTVNVTRTAPAGGAYSYTGAGTLSINSSTGLITPSTSTGGTYTVIYTVGASAGCALYTTTSSVTINPLPTATISGSVSVCQNSSSPNITFTGANGTAPYTFTYKINAGGNLTVSSTGNTATVAVSTTTVTSYTYTLISVKDATATACSQNQGGTAIVTVVTPIPVPAITATPSSICLGNTSNLTIASGSSTSLISENFEGASTFSVVSTGANVAASAWINRTSIYTYNYNCGFFGCSQAKFNSGSKFMLANSDDGGGATNTALVSPSVNTMGYSALTLSYETYLRRNGSEAAVVEVSTNGGTVWTQVQSLPATGSIGNFSTQTLDLSSYINNTSVIIRFRYSGNNEWWWAIDDVTLKAASPLYSFSWTASPPTNAGLPAAAGTPSPSNTSIVINPTASGSFTYTASLNNSGCTTTRPITIVVNPLPTVSISADYCSVPGKVRLTAAGTSGVTYSWLPGGYTSSSIDVDEAGDYDVTATLITTGCSATATITVAKELVINGDFSAGNTGFTSGYDYDPTANGLVAPESEYAINNNAQFNHSGFWGYDHTAGTGTGNDKYMIVNGAKTAVQPIVWQETVTVLPGTIYYFSAWAKSMNTAPPYARLTFSVNGMQVGTTASLVAGQNNNNNPWRPQDRFYGTWMAPANVTSAVISILDLETSASGNDFGLDDISFGTLSKFITLESAPGTDAQTLCINTPITNIVYSVGSNASTPIVTGLPTGVTPSFNGVLLTLSGTPTIAGNYGYTITTTGNGNCPPSTATGTINVQGQKITLSSGNASPSVCINTPVSIGFALSGTATGATVTGLPATISGTTSGTTYTLSGTPAAAGVYPYTITTTPATGACAPVTFSGTITVTEQTITLNSANNIQTTCINSAIANIQYNIGGTGSGVMLPVAGLPAGVSGTYTSGILFITGTPTVSGTFPYTVTTSGTCTPVTASGTITVTPNGTFTLTSGPGTNIQTTCINTAITPITYVINDATDYTVTGLPAGVSGGAVSGGGFSISGTPAAPAGTYNYTLTTTGGCGPAGTSTGSITIQSQTITLTSGTASPTVCVNTMLTPDIVYTIGGTATGATVSGLPATMSYTVVGNIVTISGTPNTAAGSPFNYVVSVAGTCITPVTATGSITVSAAAIGGTLTSVSICGGGSGTLTLSGQVGTIVRWESSTDNFSTVITPITNTTISQAFTNISVPTQYRVVVGNGCGNVFSSVAAVDIHNLWTGATSTDWNTASNWSDNLVPSNSCPVVTIPVVSTLLYPILSTGAAATIISLDIKAGASLAITGNTMQLAGTITNAGVLDVTQGAMEFNGTSQSISGSLFKSKSVKDLIVTSSGTGLSVSNTAGDSLFILGSLTFGNTTADLNTGNNISLRSTQLVTASVGVLNINNVITGDVTVERYIATGTVHQRSWQLLAIPTVGPTPSTGQSIKDAWQEGAIVATRTGPGVPMNANLKPGYGTMITSNEPNAYNQPTPGFDEFTTPGPTMKTYDYLSDTYIGPATTQAAIYDQKGYIVLVRGDRSVNFSTSTGANETILRTTGRLFTPSNPPPVTTVRANKFESIGNPYASAINIEQFTKTGGVNEFIYLWDPQLGGSYSLGGYVTFLHDAVNHNYVPIPTSPIYQGPITDIQSGQAFFMQATGSNGTVSFKESDKSVGSMLVTSPVRPSQTGSKMITNVYAFNTNGSAILADGVANTFGSYSNGIDGFDARKNVNTAENLSIKVAGTLLAVERSQMPTPQDTVFLNLTSVRAQPYRYEVTSVNMNVNGLQGYLEDTYLHTQTPLNMNGTTSVDFTIANIPGSYAADRFRIVFTQVNVLPVTITEVKAYKKDKNINVEWKVENELNIKDYTVEKSADGIHFTAIATTAASGNGSSSVSYGVVDDKPVTGYNYYRIRSNNQDGKITLSQVVKVLMGTLKQDINIYPNPITDGMIHLQFMNEPEGKYKIRLLNKLGQTILTKQISRMDGNSTELIKWDFNLAHGMYQLEVTKPDGSVKNINVLY